MLDSVKEWRENNREKYNAYQREYRLRRKLEGKPNYVQKPMEGDVKKKHDEYMKVYMKEYNKKRKDDYKELRKLKSEEYKELREFKKFLEGKI